MSQYPYDPYFYYLSNSSNPYMRADQFMNPAMYNANMYRNFNQYDMYTNSFPFK